jgi:hypothetical protein
MRIFIKAVSGLMLAASLGLQAYIVLLVLYELITVGRVGFASGLGYGAILPFSIPAFLCAITLIHAAKIKAPTKGLIFTYLGSHIFIIICMFAFPGKFA